MKEAKFREKAEKKIQKKLDKATADGRLSEKYVVSVHEHKGSPRLELTITLSNGENRPIVGYLDDAYKTREEEDCSVKEVIIPIANNIIAELITYEANLDRTDLAGIESEQEEKIEGESEEEEEPSVDPDEPIEEGESENKYNGSDRNFHNNIHDNCGIPIDQSYYTLEEFCDAIRPYVAAKLNIPTEEIIIFSIENEATGESFYKLTTMNQENAPEANINALYREYRTSEAEDEKLLNKAAKSIKRLFREEKRIAEQRQTTAEELDANIVLTEVLPALGAPGENLLTSNSEFGPVKYYLPRTAYRDEIFLTCDDLVRFQLTKEEVFAEATSHLEAKAAENPPISPSAGTQIPNVIVCGSAEYALLNDYLSQAFNMLDQKENVFLSFTENSFLMYDINSDSLTEGSGLSDLVGNKSANVISDKIYKVSKENDQILTAPAEERETAGLEFEES